MKKDTFFRNNKNNKEVSEFAKRLKYLRKKMGTTQETISKNLGLGNCTYGTYENDRFLPDAKTIRDLAKYFNVSADYILGLSKDPNKLNNKDIEIFSPEITQDFYNLSKNLNIKNTFELLIHQKDFINFVSYIYLYINSNNKSIKFKTSVLENDLIDLSEVSVDSSEIYKIKLYNQFDKILNNIINKQNKNNRGE